LAATWRWPTLAQMNHSELSHMAGAVDDSIINIVEVIIIIIIYIHVYFAVYAAHQHRTRQVEIKKKRHQNVYTKHDKIMRTAYG